MVYECCGDGTFEHWRVIDVGTGKVRSEGDVNLVAAAAVPLRTARR